MQQTINIDIALDNSNLAKILQSRTEKSFRFIT